MKSLRTDYVTKAYRLLQMILSWIFSVSPDKYWNINLKRALIPLCTHLPTLPWSPERGQSCNSAPACCLLSNYRLAHWHVIPTADKQGSNGVGRNHLLLITTYRTTISTFLGTRAKLEDLFIGISNRLFISYNHLSVTRTLTHKYALSAVSVILINMYNAKCNLLLF